jgi:hypothetical protein
VELANPHYQLPFPPNVIALLFSLLPLDTRLRAREVCRGWRLFLQDASFWTHVDLSASCGVHPRFLTWKRHALALLRAACARAKGNLLSVDISGVKNYEAEDAFVRYIAEELLVLRWLDSAPVADKASLHDLVAPIFPVLTDDQVTLLCRALPVCRVRCAVECDVVEALPLLRRKPPYELLSIGKLRFFQEDEDEQALLDLASALSAYKGMEKLNINEVPLTTRAVDALGTLQSLPVSRTRTLVVVASLRPRCPR